MGDILADFYKFPVNLLARTSPQEVAATSGLFDLCQETPFDRESSLGSEPSANGDKSFLDLRTSFRSSILRMPSDPSVVVDNLRFERYSNSRTGIEAFLENEAVRRLYYSLRPMLPASLRRGLQRLALRNWERLPFPRWPVDTSVEQILETSLLRSINAERLESVPFIWFWPDGAPASAIVTHDVETSIGVNSIQRLMDVDDTFGIKTSFQLVPEQRYQVSRDLIDGIRERECEVNVHGLNHDGNLFRDRVTFLKQAALINRYVQQFRAEGFRSASMYRNLDWISELNISYDMSVPNVAHLEPQRGGCCTIFPYFVGNILELPLTTIQDYSLFHILRDYSIDIWKAQVEVITRNHGLSSFIIHPDYVLDVRALSVYKALLAHLAKMKTAKKIWIARPGDVNRWWRQRSAMTLVLEDGTWCIKGPGRERARLAFASIEDDHIVYVVGQSSEAPAELIGELLTATSKRKQLCPSLKAI